MDIKIRQTGEIKSLELINYETGINWVTDFVGNSGATIDGQFEESDGYYIADLETFEWWDEVVSDHQRLNNKIQELKQIYGTEAVDEAISSFTDCDLDAYPRALSAHLRDRL